MSKKMSKAIRTKTFDDQWLLEDEFKDWLKKFDNDTMYRCIICRKTNTLSSSGRVAITQHANGETHKGIANKRKLFFSPKGKGNMGESSKQVSFEDNGHVKDIDIIKAQVIWLLKMIDSGYSTNTSLNASRSCSLITQLHKNRYAQNKSFIHNKPWLSTTFQKMIAGRH